jgi:hypothetical protein
MNIHTLVLEPFMEMFTTVISFIPTLLIALGILVIGWLVSKTLGEMITQLFKAIEFDKVADKMGMVTFFKKGGIKHEPSALFGCMTYVIFMLITLILTVKALGLSVASGLIDSMLMYVPSVISGALILIIGMYLARFVSVLVYIAAKNTDMPIPAVIARLSKWAIMIYVSILYLKEIGFVSLFVGVHYTIFIGGVVFALALAFGLAGKDVAGYYLGVFKSHKTSK